MRNFITFSKQIFSTKNTRLYNFEDTESFIPGQEKATHSLTGPIYTDKISESHFKKLDYPGLITEIENYISKDIEDYALIALGKLFPKTIYNLKNLGIENGTFYYLNSVDIPQSSIFEINVYDYYITIIAELKHGILLRLTFGND